jgi:hypothetical protein
MLVIWSLAFTVVAVRTMISLYRRRRRRRSGTPLRKVFTARELRRLDAHLDRVAVDELEHLTAQAIAYVAGVAGHVVAVWEMRQGVALILSDGRRLGLGQVSRRALPLLVARAQQDRLRPARVERDGLFFRLVLRGDAGTYIAIHARRLAVTP